MDKRVFVIDDDQDILEAIQYILDGSGYQTITNTGDEYILNKVQEAKPDVIILDILLSGKDGREICKILKKNKETKHIPIIMISAHANAADSIETCGADDFIAKPFEMDEFLGKIEKQII